MVSVGVSVTGMLGATVDFRDDSDDDELGIRAALIVSEKAEALPAMAVKIATAFKEVDVENFIVDDYLDILLIITTDLLLLLLFCCAEFLFNSVDMSVNVVSLKCREVFTKKSGFRSIKSRYTIGILFEVRNGCQQMTKTPCCLRGW